MDASHRTSPEMLGWLAPTTGRALVAIVYLSRTAPSKNAGVFVKVHRGGTGEALRWHLTYL
jgi:hypothetical protein